MTTMPRSGGFSLIEVLVAFAILAIALTTILSLLSTGLRNSAVAREYAQALVLAEAKMAAMQGIDSARLVPAISEDVFDGRYHWRSEVQLQSDTPSGAAGMALYVLAVEVRWQAAAGMRRIDLATVRVGRAP